MPLSAKFFCTQSKDRKQLFWFGLGLPADWSTPVWARAPCVELNLMRQSKACQSACFIPKDEEHKKDRAEVFGETRKQVAFSE